MATACHEGCSILIFNQVSHISIRQLWQWLLINSSFSSENCKGIAKRFKDSRTPQIRLVWQARPINSDKENWHVCQDLGYHYKQWNIGYRNCKIVKLQTDRQTDRLSEPNCKSRLTNWNQKFTSPSYVLVMVSSQVMAVSHNHEEKNKRVLLNVLSYSYILYGCFFRATLLLVSSL